MGETVKVMFGATPTSQKREQQRLAAERRRLAALEDGQRKVRAGGGRGLLAYVEEAAGDTFGGGRSG